MGAPVHSPLLVALLPAALLAGCGDDTAIFFDASVPSLDQGMAVGDLASRPPPSDGAVPQPDGAVGDVTAPSFAGLTSAVAAGDRSIALAWSAATDDTTAADAIVYDIYVATTMGGESFATPSFTSPAGASGVTVAALQPGTTYYFVVRARDQAGHRDGNQVERSATTAPDTTAPLFAGVASATPLTPTSVRLDWSAAMDDVSAPAQIVYDVYAATAMMAEDFSTPLATTAGGATSFTASGLTPGTTYYFVVRARDQAGNADANTNEVTATTSGDVTAPTWNGTGLTVTAVAAPVTSRIDVTWTNDASDDQTSGANMRFVVSWSGGGNATTAAGATGYLIQGLTSNSSYTVSVRAEDEAGNLSAAATGAATTPVSFASDVAPITFTGVCANCHTWSWSNTVGVTSDLCGGVRIVPGDPASSVLFGAISKPSPGCPPDRMPRGGPYLSSAQLAVIQTWIQQSANDN